MDRLGRFVLTRFLGRGGMGEVWQGHHLVDQTPVAIKLVDGPLAGRRQSISAEIRAISALDHPHIIWIYDQGVVDGRPYFAMELAEGGNLVESPPTDWLSLRDVLVQLLSALSHAHARGVLHRDIKPENVLCGGARPGIKLADFGLGVFFQDDDRAGLGSGGTPAYMAPEQFEQQRASFGPWTDLYALGCMTYALAAGQRPFPERDFAGLRAAHLHRTIPPLRPRFPVPPTLEAWIRRAMMRAIQERFANAAEAAAALPDNSILSASMVSIRDIALTEQATNTDPGRADDQPVSADVPEAVQPLPRPRPLAAPEDWRQPPRTSLRLMGAGLSLFGLRALPLIGREKERDLLWAALRKGLQGDSFPIVFIEGAAGVGKSRLARWLCDTAAELGLSQPIRAEHSRAGAPGDGLPGALCRAIGLSRDTLTVPELQRRLEGLWPPDSPGWRALCALLHRQPDRSSPREQQVLQAQVLRFLSPRTLLWIDDGQWATDSLGFLRRLAEDPTALNGMAVVTLRSETLPEERAARRQLDAIPGKRLALTPLSPSVHRRLIQEMLGLEPRLIAQLALRTQGNPLLTVQLIGDWVQRGLLTPQQGGFRLSEGAETPLPSSIHEIWSDRFMQLLADRPFQERIALELAAALGESFETTEWEQLLDGKPVPATLIERMLDQRLLESTRDGWRFVHGMLRESILVEAGIRAPQHHRACAEMLAGRGAPARRARHLLEAGALADAIPLLMEGIRIRIMIASFPEAEALLDQLLSALRETTDETDPRWGWAWVALGRVAGSQGRLDDALRWLTRAADAAHEQDWADVQANAAEARGVIALLQGDLPQARALQTAALEQAALLDDRPLQVRAMNSLGWLHLRTGEFDVSDAMFERAARIAEDDEDRAGAMDSWFALAYLAAQRGDLTRARDALAHARDHAEAIPSRLGVAQGDNFAGELARMDGRLGEAEHAYRRAWRGYAELEREEASMARCNLGTALLVQGRVQEARQHLIGALVNPIERSQFVLGPQARAAVLPVLQSAVGLSAHLGLLACAAGGSDEDWTHHRQAVEQILEQTGLSDPEFLRLAELAARHAETAGRPQRANQAHQLAKMQRSALQARGWIES